jgi:hypothetical protein
MATEQTAVLAGRGFVGMQHSMRKLHRVNEPVQRT